MQTQLEIFNAFDEARCYHDSTRHGFFSLLVATDRGGNKKKQESYRLATMPMVLGQLDFSRDTWMSQAEFISPNRRVVNLARIGLLFADLDTYRMPWAQGRNPEQLASSVLFFCQEEGIPTPSILIFSGRGIQAKWLLEGTLPRQALPRWNACQKYLIDRLAIAGADPAAKDASRVLRLVDTVNSKSGEICHVIHVEQGKNGEPIRYNFEYLAEVLLPVARTDIQGNRQVHCTQKQKTSRLRTFSGQKLAWDRLEDLRTLAAIRGGVSEGERMLHLFWRLNFLLLSGATHSSQMYYEAAALAHELDTRWNYRSTELMTLYAKAKAHEAGERVEFRDQQFSPLYTPKNDTLISLFRITDEEQKQLRTLICQDIAKERDKTRKSKQRRTKGMMERVIYEATSLSTQKPWEALGISRASWYRAGKPMA